MVTIRESVQHCYNLFDRWSEIASSEEELLAVKLENDLFRFNLWVEHYSATSPGHDSLDWRLRESSTTYSVVLDLVEDLSLAIIAQLDPTSASVDRSQDDPGVVLDRLLRYSRAIRRSGALRRLAKASDYVEYDVHDTDLNLTAKFREMTDQYLRMKLPQMGQGLHERLLDTICIRQRSFAFQRSRQGKRALKEMIATNVSPAKSQTTPQTGSAYSMRPHPKGKPPSVSKSQQAAGRKRRLEPPQSATTFRSIGSHASLEEHDPSDITFMPENLPPRPNVPSGMRYHECPYCFVLCPASDFSESGWSRHIIQDLMPFVCTLAECKTPDVLYHSKIAWKSHMETDHASKGWICMDPDHTLPEVFVRIQAFKDHIKQEHEDDLNSEDLDAIADECFGDLQEDASFTACPFLCDNECGDAFATMEDGERELHVARHLLDLAQISLSGHDPVGLVESGSTAVVSHMSSSRSQGSGKRSHESNASQAKEPLLVDEEEQNLLESDEEMHSGTLGNYEMRHITPPDVSNWTGICHDIKRRKGLLTEKPEMDSKLKHFAQVYFQQEGKDLARAQPPSPDPISDDLESRKGFEVRPDTLTQEEYVQRFGKEKVVKPNSSLIMQRIRGAVVKSSIQGLFVPDSQISAYVTGDVVQTELSSSEFSLARFWKARKSRISIDIDAAASYRRILTVLYLMKVPSKIRLFVASGVTDDDLPFSRIGNSDALKSRHRIDAPEVFFEKRKYAEEFVERQWSVLVPYFDGPDGNQIPHQDFESETILPFLSQTARKESGHASTLKTEIHPDHHSLPIPPGKRNTYAVKVLRSEDERAFVREVTVMRKLSHAKHMHPHLVSLLSTYRYRGVYHLIMPWAKFDLHEYWQHKAYPPKDDQMETWIIEQCRGLAEGLYRLHRYATSSDTSLRDFFEFASEERPRHQEGVRFHNVRHLFGHHGDVSLGNILWFPEARSTGGNGILKLTNFGIARFSNEDVWDSQKKRRLPVSLSFQSPEYDVDGRNPSSISDVWALGCVYLDFITWYFGGYSLVEHFGRRRLLPDEFCANIPTDTFFTTYDDSGVKRAKVKDSVTEMIEELREHQRCTQDFEMFLDIVQRDMLVILPQETQNEEYNGQGLQDQTNLLMVRYQEHARRKSCGDIFRALGDIQPRWDSEED